MTLTSVLVLTALTGTALMAGVFFAFGTAVMGSLQRMPEGQGAAAMNTINVRIQNPLFVAIFTGTALACLALAFLAVAQEAPGRWCLLTGALLYLGGCVVLTSVVNIPLNNRLAAVDPATAAGVRQWHDYVRTWNPANNLRARTCTLAVIAFGIALAEDGTSGTPSAQHRSGGTQTVLTTASVRSTDAGRLRRHVLHHRYETQCCKVVVVRGGHVTRLTMGSTQ